MRHLLLLLVGVLTGSPLAAVAQCTPPASALDMFAGSWVSSGTIALNAPTRVSGSNTCAWSDTAHVFLVCNGTFQTENDSTVHHQLSVYTYDASSGKYTFASISPGNVSSPELTLSVNTWTYSGKFTDSAGHTTYFRTLNIFESADRYRYEIQNSSDGVHWTMTGNGLSRRPA